MKCCNGQRFRFLIPLSMLYTSMVVTTSVHAADPVLDAFDEPAEAIRIHAYYANIPDFEFPCEFPELIFQPAMVSSLPPEQRFEFQKIRKVNGRFQEAIFALEENRQLMVEKAKAQLDAALEGYFTSLERSEQLGGLVSGVTLQQHDQALENQINAAYYEALYQAFSLYQSGKTVFDITKEYYDLVAVAFTGLDILEQDQTIQHAWDRLKCLREHRLAVFKKLMKTRITLEHGLEAYLSQEFGKQAKDEIYSIPIDQLNQQIQFLALRVQYNWLSTEFGNQSAICRKLLTAHEQTVRNSGLLPVLQELQQAYPSVMPSYALPGNSESDRMRAKLARVRAKLGLLELLKNEALLEGTCSTNLNLSDRLWKVGEDVYKKAVTGKDIAEWVARNKWQGNQQAINRSGWEFMGLALVKQVLGNVMDQLITTPLKDQAIIELQSLGVFDVGWKTSTEANFESYQQSVLHLGPGIAFLENWSESLVKQTAQQYVDSLTPDGQNQLSSKIFIDFLSNYEFIQKTNGGVAGILEVLIEDPADLRKLWLISSVQTLEARLRDGRNRIAKIRGIEAMQSPTATVTQADLKMGILGPIDQWSDTFFEIPSIVKNVFAEIGGESPSQDDYLQKLSQFRSPLKSVVFAASRVAYDPERLASAFPIGYADHLNLSSRSVDYAIALHRIASAEWERTRIYTAANARKSRQSHFGTATDLTNVGMVRAASVQQKEAKSLMEKSERIAFLQLEYLAQTGNYAAAATQMMELQKLQNQVLASRGLKTRLDYANEVSELKLKAAAQETVVVYEALLNEAIQTVVTSAATTYVVERYLGGLQNKQWLKQYLDGKQPMSPDDIRNKVMSTLFPVYQAYGWSNAWSLVEGTGWTLAKEKLAFEVSQAANVISGENVWDQSDFQPLVDVLVDVGKDVIDATYPAALESMVQSSVGWYAEENKVNLLLDRASEAKATLQQQLANAGNRTLETLENLKWCEIPRSERDRLMDELELAIRNPMLDSQVQTAYATYWKVHEELESSLAQQRQRRSVLENSLLKLNFMDDVRKAAESKFDQFEANTARGPNANPLQILEVSRTWNKLLFDQHTNEDLEMIATRSRQSDDAYHSLLLTPTFDIDVLRKAFSDCIEMAKTPQGGGEAEVEKIRELAQQVDDLRIDRINTILNDFLEQYRWGEKVALVIQGGAAKGNPEYQGLFADIDFTLMLKQDSNADQKALKQDMLDYFKLRGYLLASDGVTSSMDSEGFVQKLGVFDSASASRRQIIEDVQEKSKDPTRFYTEGGTLWFINNAAYSGKVLWQGNGASVNWVQVPQDFGYDLAVDMTRYLGFLASPKYSDSYLAGKDVAYQTEVLEKALGKGKYFIRLIDAYEIGHDQGNVIYNDRMQNRQESGDDASYHLQIYKDAVKMVDAQNPDDPKNVITAADLPMIERLAKMKMKGKYASPFEVLRSEGLTGAAAVAEAQKMLNWMRETGSNVIAKLADDFHSNMETRATAPAEADRNATFASVMRMISVNRNILTLDSPEAAPLVVSKVQGDRVLTLEEHGNLIRMQINTALNGDHIASELQGQLDAPFVSEDDEKRRQQAAEVYLNSEAAKLHNPPASELAMFRYEKLMKPWMDMMRYFANKIE